MIGMALFFKTIVEAPVNLGHGSGLLATVSLIPRGLGSRALSEFGPGPQGCWATRIVEEVKFLRHFLRRVFHVRGYPVP